MDYKDLDTIKGISDEIKALIRLKLEVEALKDLGVLYLKERKQGKKAREKVDVIYRECDEMAAWGAEKVMTYRKMTKEEIKELYKEIDTKKERLKELKELIKLKSDFLG